MIFIVSYKVIVIIYFLFFVLGYCVRYSIDKKWVEENYENGFECLKFDESERCLIRYLFIDVYKCKYI